MTNVDGQHSRTTRERLWRRCLIALFVAVVAFTAYYAVRTVSDAI